MKPAQKSRKMRKIFRKTPGGKTTKIAKRRKTYKVNCGICKKTLQGSTNSRKSSKTQKHPTRKYAGNLCHSCTTKLIKLQARVKEGELVKEKIEPRFKKYL